jgi:hypothetical protein
MRHALSTKEDYRVHVTRDGRYTVQPYPWMAPVERPAHGSRAMDMDMVVWEPSPWRYVQRTMAVAGVTPRRAARTTVAPDLDALIVELHATILSIRQEAGIR